MKAKLDFQASAIWCLLQEVRDVAETKMLAICLTLEMSHESSPTPANLDALLNVSFSVFTLATLHLLRSEFISPAL